MCGSLKGNLKLSVFSLWGHLGK